MLVVLFATAQAVEPPPEVRPIGLDDVVAVDVTATDTILFELRACDRIRSQYVDPRPPEQARSEKVVITLRNTTGSLCLYRGVVLKGALTGTYVSSIRNPDGTGFFIPPLGEVSFRVKPDDPALPRNVVNLQIAPGSGTVVLTGLPADAVRSDAAEAPTPP